MATVQYRDPSPFATPRPAPPPDDYLFARYMESFSLDESKSARDQKEEQVGVALCGCGKAGNIHLSNLLVSPRVKLLYIVDDMDSKWEGVRRFWHMDASVRFLLSKDSQTVFDDPRVQAVVVASPTYTHEKIVQAALKSGKAVFCEKPIAENRESIRRCYQLAEKVGKPLMCAFNRRFDASFASVRKQVREGKVGHVHMMKTCSRDSPMPSLDYLKTSGGIFHDCAVHDIDMVIWTLGELPRRVCAVANANMPEIRQIGDFDTVAIVMNFPSGSVAIIDLSRRASYGYDQRLEVFGPRGMVSCQNERPMPGVETQQFLQGCNHTPIWYSFPSRFKQAYFNEMQHFLDVVQGKSKLTVHANETLAVSKIASALDESARTGKHIDLTWAPEEMLPIVDT